MDGEPTEADGNKQQQQVAAAQAGGTQDANAMHNLDQGTGIMCAATQQRLTLP